MTLIKSKKQKRKQAGNAALNFPAPSYFINPDNEVDIDLLIKVTRRNKDFNEEKFLTVFQTLHKNVGFGHRNDALDMVKLLLGKFSDCFQYSGTTENDSIYLGWTRLCEGYSCDDAAQKILSFSLDKQANDEIICHWANAAADLLVSKMNIRFQQKADDYAINKLHDLVKMVSPNHPILALQLSFKLIGVCTQRGCHDEVMSGAKSLSQALLNKLSSDRIIALESIEPSSDRSTKQTCDRFESLTQIPIKLIRSADTSELKQTLDSEFPWFAEITEKLVKSLLIRQLGTGTFYFPPMLILGPPGIGKTTYVNRLSQLAGVPFRVMNMAGKNDNRDLVGTARGWGTGHPSMPIALINEHKIGNPIIVVDELDKCGGSDHNGRALDALLTLFEPSSASRVFDEFLCGNANFSFISWIATANGIKQVPTTLLSRLDVVTAVAPKPEHYPAIIKVSVHNFCKVNGIHTSQVPPITEADWRWLSQHYKTPRIAKKAAEKWLTYHLLNPHNSRLN